VDTTVIGFDVAVREHDDPSSADCIQWIVTTIGPSPGAVLKEP
jgi:hypothetical protein